MRLPHSLKQQLIEQTLRFFGPVPVYLFGSRCDDTRRGGDVDIAIRCNEARGVFKAKTAQLSLALEQLEFPLPVDIVQWHEHTDELLKRELEHTARELRKES